MPKNINFPNLGIHLTNVGKEISIFGFEIAFYGIIIGLAILAGIFIATAEAKRTRQNPENYYDLAIYAVVFSIIGARLYYVIFSWDQYKNDLLSISRVEYPNAVSQAGFTFLKHPSMVAIQAGSGRSVKKLSNTS